MIKQDRFFPEKSQILWSLGSVPDKLEPNNNQEAQAYLGLPELLLPVL